MKKLVMSAAILSCFLLSFTSCKKDDEKDDVKEILTSKEWKYVIIGSVENGISVNGELNPGYYDDRLIFKPNGVYIYDPGQDICSDEKYTKGVWSLSSNEKQIIIHMGEDILSKEIISVSRDQIILKRVLQPQTAKIELTDILASAN